MASRWETLNVDGVPMITYVAVPDGNGPFPAVIVAQHAGGVDQFMQEACDRLAEAGYAAAAPDLYHRQEEDVSFEEIIALYRSDPRRDEIIPPRMENLRDEEIVRDMNAAAGYLMGLDTVGGPLGVTGFCMGGRVAYLVATRNADVKAASCFYPGNLFTPKGDGPSPFAASDRISCPVQGFFGKDDQNPSPEDMAKVDAELSRLGIPHEFHSYEGAAHAFMDGTKNSPSYREHAAKDAWPKLLAFFEQHLKAGVRV